MKIVVSELSQPMNPPTNPPIHTSTTIKSIGPHSGSAFAASFGAETLKNNFTQNRFWFRNSHWGVKQILNDKITDIVVFMRHQNTIQDNYS